MKMSRCVARVSFLSLKTINMCEAVTQNGPLTDQNKFPNKNKLVHDL